MAIPRGMGGRLYDAFATIKRHRRRACFIAKNSQPSTEHAQLAAAAVQFEVTGNEMGHIKTNFSKEARPCVCGAKGCLAAYSSMFGILQHMDLLADAPFPPVESLDARFEQFLDSAERGDVLARSLLELAGFHLGVVIANHINATDPGNVLLLASHIRFLTFSGEKLNAAIRENTLPGMLACTNIILGISNQDWRWKGTAALALEQAYLSNSYSPAATAQQN